VGEYVLLAFKPFNVVVIGKEYTLNPDRRCSDSGKELPALHWKVDEDIDQRCQ
jgi:hypothetical protein